LCILQNPNKKFCCGTDQCGGQGGVRLAQGLGAHPDQVGEVRGRLLGVGVGQQVLPCSPTINRK